MTLLTKENVAQALLDIGAVSLNPSTPYTWTSGLRAPIYTDNRLIISFPKTRELIIDGFVSLIKKHYPQAEMIAGTATAGIPHAAFIAQKLDLPMIYVRSSAKGHGKKNAIEGYLAPNSKVIMIEDLISTGKSVLHAADIVNENGGQVLACLAIFNYCLPISESAFQDKKYELRSLTDYPTLIEVASREKDIQESKEL